MILHCSTADGWSLRDPENFRAFKVVLDGLDLDSAPALAGLSCEGKHAWIAPDLPARLASRTADDEWAAGFAKMVAVAANHGWVREDGAIRAHVEQAS